MTPLSQTDREEWRDRSQAVATLDDLSEKGSWEQHLRDTDCMRQAAPVREGVGSIAGVR